MTTTAADRTCCPTHPDRCRYGGMHVFAVGIYHDGTWRPSLAKCIDCGGICAAEEHPTTPPPDTHTKPVRLCDRCGWTSSNDAAVVCLRCETATRPVWLTITPREDTRP